MSAAPPTAAKEGTLRRRDASAARRPHARRCVCRGAREPKNWRLGLATPIRILASGLCRSKPANRIRKTASRTANAPRADTEVQGEERSQDTAPRESRDYYTRRFKPGSIKDQCGPLNDPYVASERDMEGPTRCGRGEPFSSARHAGNFGMACGSVRQHLLAAVDPMRTNGERYTAYAVYVALVAAARPIS
jgi:hypothetical protein